MKALISFLMLVPMMAIGQKTTLVLAPYFYDPTSLGGYQGPFLWLDTQAPSIRYQQVYQNSDFQLFTTGPQTTTEITFATGAGPLNVNLASIQMDLSTTSKAPDGLSSIFSQNIGSDDKTVFSGPVHLFSDGSTYGVRIPLQQPFFYDPGVENLLLDVRNFKTIPAYFPSGRFHRGCFAPGEGCVLLRGLSRREQSVGF
jgi:hypothetical protein